jgi:hypothetical protein
MIFKMYNCDFSVGIGGVDYSFDHVDSMAIEDPQSSKLIRGSNAGNKTGLVYTEGAKSPKKLTLVIIGLTAVMYELFRTVYLEQTRCECRCIDRTTGSAKIAKECVLSQQPMQLTVDENPESMNVSLIFETFNFEETHKD